MGPSNFRKFRKFAWREVKRLMTNKKNSIKICKSLKYKTMNWLYFNVYVWDIDWVNMYYITLILIHNVM